MTTMERGIPPRPVPATVTLPDGEVVVSLVRPDEQEFADVMHRWAVLDALHGTLTVWYRLPYKPHMREDRPVFDWLRRHVVEMLDGHVVERGEQRLGPVDVVDIDGPLQMGCRYLVASVPVVDTRSVGSFDGR